MQEGRGFCAMSLLVAETRSGGGGRVHVWTRGSCQLTRHPYVSGLCHDLSGRQAGQRSG